MDAKNQRLPVGEEFGALCRRAASKPADEKAKMALAGRYFSEYMDEEYEALAKLVAPKTPEEQAMFNNQKMLVALVRYTRTHQDSYLTEAKELSKKTVIFPRVKAFFVQVTEAPEKEVLQEGYKLDRKCPHSAILKASAFIRAKKYDEALAVLDRLPERVATLLLRLSASIRVKEEGECHQVYIRLLMNIEQEEKDIEKEDVTEVVKKRKLEHLELEKKHALRLAGKGVGVGLDALLAEIEGSIKVKAGLVLASAEQLVRDTATHPEEGVLMVRSSQRLFLEVEILRAQALQKRKRYTETQKLATYLKSVFSGVSESTDEKIALLLMQTHLETSTLKDLDLPWIIHALSKRERVQKDINLSEFVALAKKKQPVPPTFDRPDAEWTKKMLALQDTPLLWKVEIDRGRYLNRLGNIEFAQMNIKQAEEAYASALKVAEDKDRACIQKNSQTLEKWITREDKPISEYPECQVLLRACGGAKDLPWEEYVEKVTGNGSANPESTASTASTANLEKTKKTEKLVTDLEDIAKVLQDTTGVPHKGQGERIANILAFCSLLRYKKEILSISEVASSSMSIVYNHIVFWARENRPIDSSVLDKAIDCLAQAHRGPAEKILAKKAVLTAMEQLSRENNGQRFEEVLARTKGLAAFSAKEKKLIEKIRPQNPAPEAPGTAEDSAQATDQNPENPKPSEPTDPELTTKRDEVMRMLTQKPETKAPKTPKAPKKTKSAPEDDVPAKRPKAAPRSPPSTPQPIQRKSHTIISSDEEES
ncbi:hypothetical protein NEDG_01034 [Nematocida displodere]|uniref:Uncharacterized protein n=1 Tax=Nematocida displodere TaxID=1805483 RepID=A0A177EAF4_9MICR|nr:hypothetical protein NEDG_01034 [Nematocida displodere]